MNMVKKIKKMADKFFINCDQEPKMARRFGSGWRVIEIIYSKKKWTRLKYAPNNLVNNVPLFKKFVNVKTELWNRMKKEEL